MNSQSQEKTNITPREYLEFEKESSTKHEYFNGEIFAMTGASLSHNRINVNITRELGNQLKGSSCDAFSSDMRIKVNELEKYIYPDIAVVCGDIELENIKGVETLLNPVVIIEILSDATEAYDRGTKFSHYRLIPSLQEYILVSQNFCNVEQFLRGNDGIWQVLNPRADMKHSLKFNSIDCEVFLSDIYYRVEFDDQG